jgi:23S rRNA G2445 N2-methylase RlmL
LKLIAACAFGLEALLKRELIALGYTPHVDQPGRVCFLGDWPDVCRANLWLRTADRVLIEVLKFPAPDFDALFDTVKGFDWSEFLPADAQFPVNAKSRLSLLTSIPAVQRSVKKAMVESLSRVHRTTTLPESGAEYPVEVALLNDVATITLDTTGASLHKRGYRKLNAEAPIKETLAAALVDLSVWHPDRLLVDPFCGSGTIPIEAAMIGMNIAPGLNREFACEHWSAVPTSAWAESKQEAREKIRHDRQLQIIGSDRDAKVLELAEFHAEKAGVKKQIRFEHRDFRDLQSDVEYACIVTNPPYGERLEEEDAVRDLYLTIPRVMRNLPTWSLFLITSFPQFEGLINKEADRRRKLYNGRIECTYYQYLGPRPPRGHFPERQTQQPHHDQKSRSDGGQ